jgi:choline dehydrogenase-like flavoprotein
MAVSAVDLSSLLWFKPPVSFLNPPLRREFIDRHFKRDVLKPRGILWVLDRFGPKLALDLFEGGLRFNQQLANIGYYSDPRVHAEIGYVPFSERSKDFPIHPVREHPPLNVMTPEVLNRRGIDTIHSADVVIIGTGAGGATLAEQLANMGREVLLLEKGAYVPPDEFSEDEVGMIGRLYRDGALQISQSLRFTILQGSVVGGTTVVNNAVCFDTPDRVLALWNDPQGLNAGLDLADFKAAQQAVRQRMGIQPILNSVKTRPGLEVLNPGDVALEKGIEAALPAQGYKYDVVEANIADCLGCGYCNIGCKYGRKLSMLDRVLPAAQASHGADRFQILSETEAVRLRGENGRITEIEARVEGKRRLFIRNPKTVILSAGTLASSWLLLQSGIGQGELPVGRWLSFNMGSPLHGWFDRKLNSYAGLQISHYLELADHPGFVYETWYNPPVAQALAMPGWLDTHYQNMRRYAEIAGVGVLVGTEPNPEAHLRRALFLPGSPDVVYAPTPRDLDTLATALIILGKIMLAAGAKEIFASTRKYQSYSPFGAEQNGKTRATYRSEGDLEQLRGLIQTERDILLGTGHPQGGNRISQNRGRNGLDGGVIDPGFKVYGYDNLYVCDASVHPTATTVNPQLTVMTLARYAADRIGVG